MNRDTNDTFHNEDQEDEVFGKMEILNLCNKAIRLLNESYIHLCLLQDKNRKIVRIWKTAIPKAFTLRSVTLDY